MIRLSWTDFKTFVDARNLLIHEIESNDLFLKLEAHDGPVKRECRLAIGSADYTDYTTNYQNSSNKSLFFAPDDRNFAFRVTGNGTTTIKSGQGILKAVVINNDNTGGTYTIYDNTAGSGTILFTGQIGTPSGGLLSTSGIRSPVVISPLNVQFDTGLTIVLSGSTSNDLTILYR